MRILFSAIVFLQELHLSVPVDIIKFTPGGSIVSTVAVAQVPPNRNEANIRIDGARMLQEVRPHLQEVHTRMQKKLFKEKISNIANIQPSVTEFIYKELALDGSQATNPALQERLRLIFLGDSDLLADLRHSNPGRPGGTFDVFLES